MCDNPFPTMEDVSVSKSNVSAYDKYLALRKSWLVMVDISDKDVYVGSNPTLVITTALFGGKFMWKKWKL